MNTITIEYKKGESAVHVFFQYNEKFNECARMSGGKFTQYPTRKGWKFSPEGFESFRANLPRYNAWDYPIVWVDGNAPKPEPEPVAMEYRTGFDGEHRMAVMNDLLGYNF